MKPTFATNRPATVDRPEERVADAVNGLLGHLLDKWKDPFELAIATGYFNPGGFDLIADALERVGEVRLLIGAEPEVQDRRIRNLQEESPPARAMRARLRRALTEHAHEIEEDRDLLGFSISEDACAQRLIRWLGEGRVKVRRLEKRFLHGKAFLVTTDTEGVIAGSSNFTYAGLAKSAELNLGHYQPEVVQKVAEWFEEQWEDASEFDLAAIYEARYAPHNPYLIYMRMLFERYGAEIQEEVGETGLGTIHLTSFQRDGVWRAKRILKAKRGVVIADDVGLGKTYIGGELIREAVEDRRQRVLLIAPASLRDGPWRSFLAEFQLGIEVVSFEELTRDNQLNPAGLSATLKYKPNEYAMVVIDEAHAFRNPDTQRANVLRALLAGTPAKDLVLLTATPVNNSLWDLFHLLKYFLKNDADFADIGIMSLHKHFAEVSAIAHDEVSPEYLFDVLDAVAVRRTRHFVKRYYPNETVVKGGLEVPITFPEPNVRKVTYDLNEVLPDFFTEFAHALSYDLDGEGGEVALDATAEEAPRLTLARYAPSRYLRNEDASAKETQLAGLIRSGLLKRFESSAHAFGRTCLKMANSHDAFLSLLEEGSVATGRALAEWTESGGDIEEFIAGRLGDEVEPASAFHVDPLREDVKRDRDLLRYFASRAAEVTPERDAKLAALAEELRQIVREADEEGVTDDDERDKRKVVIFSYFADTVAWVSEYLADLCATDPALNIYAGRMASVSGDEGNRGDILFGFAPISSEAPPGRAEDRFDVLVSTDVLAEGVNLQQARHIINYDLPWNPMRLVQRHGRIDRIGSKHDKVYLRCFFPDEQLDALLHLEERLHRKIAHAAASIGVANEVIPGSIVRDRSYAHTRAEIEKLRAENPDLFENAGETSSAFSGEEYRQELREGLSHRDLAEDIRRLPWGSGSGRAVVGSEPGFVFCARIGNHPTPVFRYVGLDDPENPLVLSDTLTCLAKAHSRPDTTRVLPDEAHRNAYTAWGIAREDILTRWTAATDLRTLQPVVPRAMRDAAEHLRDNQPPEVEHDVLVKLLDALEAPYTVRIQRAMRQALNTPGTDIVKARAVIAAIRELGLQPPTPPEPLPVIDEGDIHLVCWMAIVPERRQPGRAVQFGAPEQTTFMPGTQVYLGED